MRSWGAFTGPLREAIHRLKYRKDVALGEALSRPLQDLVRSLNWPIDLIVPVPLSDQRLRERGYNQADCLALPMALALGVDYHSRALLRIKNTQSQVGLSAHQRKENVLNAFSANPRLVTGRQVLVIDDVATTGATIHSCAGALLDAGAVQVFGMTLARAFHYPVE
ncbi:MAG TPA: ComF family protein [Anaerolineaceae bacterium]|nr:ComF family protein [Anaerolineaceae bacterium]